MHYHVVIGKAFFVQSSPLPIILFFPTFVVSSSLLPLFPSHFFLACLSCFYRYNEFSSEISLVRPSPPLSILSVLFLSLSISSFLLFLSLLICTLLHIQISKLVLVLFLIFPAIVIEFPPLLPSHFYIRIFSPILYGPLLHSYNPIYSPPLPRLQLVKKLATSAVKMVGQLFVSKSCVL